ncbi:P-loop containing nucleoside triphosphate hydrolase protein [Pelagophyceae sp. CCMP2097]|nr:P-loop containing nucleoside triphosphate hydrolase protein [Pelagophyceae sp. CCMP2097]
MAPARARLACFACAVIYAGCEQYAPQPQPMHAGAARHPMHPQQGPPPQQRRPVAPQAGVVGPGAARPAPTAQDAELARITEDSQFDKEFFLGELKKMYKRRMLPLETASRYDHFVSAPMGPADFEAKPMVLLLGQYSVGKTSFIRTLLGRDFPGQSIGPEPTTDRFTAVFAGAEQRPIPGHALASRPDRPFTGLQGFGSAFLNRFQGAEVPSPVLENVTLIDTPGVLAGAEQNSRGYHYPSVVQWFAERSDLILLMFDAHKLDISDELRETIDRLRPHFGSVRVVLNKAETCTPQQLLRVYGALMWQLGRVMATPEVVRVHLGAFGASNLPCSSLVAHEQADLLRELRDLPRHAVLRRVGDLAKRYRSLKAHCLLVHTVRKRKPYFKHHNNDERLKILKNMRNVFEDCRARYNLPPGDMPNVEVFREALAELEDKIFDVPKLDKRQLDDLDKMFAVDIPALLEKATRAPQ